jgi:hypothetical protein
VFHGLTRDHRLSPSAVQEAKDWKVVGMVPGAGTVVKSDEPVVLNLFKVR